MVSYTLELVSVVGTRNISDAQSEFASAIHDNSKECKCKDPEGCKGTCGAAKYKGDGNCDDNNK